MGPQPTGRGSGSHVVPLGCLVAVGVTRPKVLDVKAIQQHARSAIGTNANFVLSDVPLRPATPAYEHKRRL
jgi:hypothetical protein